MNSSLEVCPIVVIATVVAAAAYFVISLIGALLSRLVFPYQDNEIVRVHTDLQLFCLLVHDFERSFWGYMLVSAGMFLFAP